MKTGRFDFLAIQTYFPPRPGVARHQRTYEKTVEVLMGWAKQTIQTVGARTAVFWGGDFNENLGIPERPEDQGAPEETGIGLLFPQKEHSLGTRLRQLCGRFNLAVANTFFDGASTWY